VFDAVKAATDKGTDADRRHGGRLQNKRELMEELAKIRRVLGRLNPAAPHDVVLVLDATNGQNALAQIETFKEVAGVTGLVMTKLDGTARGGVLVAAAEQYGLPIHAIGVGETIDDLRPFDPDLVARVIAGVAARATKKNPGMAQYGHRLRPGSGVLPGLSPGARQAATGIGDVVAITKAPAPSWRHAAGADRVEMADGAHLAHALAVRAGLSALAR
jgi:hypothetical protein